MTPRALLLILALVAPFTRAADDYKPGPDSIKRHDGVTKGRLEKFVQTSHIYPGTTRDVWVYIPEQYDGKTPACLMVFQDGAGYVSEKGLLRAPVVLDNLIAARQIPVMIGVFIDPGNDLVANPPATTKPAPGVKAKAKYSDRSNEYDTLSDKYAGFLLEEILPEVKKRYDVKITEDPEGRGLCGGSSGAICAFTVAWERPDSFRKVASFIGSFTNIKGGNKYPQLVRESPKKPIRVSLQDGSGDLQNQFGKWFEANQAMAAALKEMGYDYQFIVGDGGHTAKHQAAILPDVLRWLWRDYKAAS